MSDQAMQHPFIGVQMYTLRDLASADFAGTAAAVAKIGYWVVELAGYGNLPGAAEVRAVLDDLGLRVASGQVPYDYLSQYTDHCLAEAGRLDQPVIAVPSVPERLRGTADGYREAADVLNTLGERCRTAGIALCYHHHSFEWQPLPTGERGIDVLMQRTDPSLVNWELDTYWLRHAGEVPEAFISAAGNRVKVVHLKDMLPDAERRFAPVGDGTIDFPPVFAAMAQIDSMPVGIVEQDTTYDLPPLEAVKRSWTYLQRLLQR